MFFNKASRIITSVVDPNTLGQNHRSGSKFNLNPDPGLYRYCQFWKKDWKHFRDKPYKNEYKNILEINRIKTNTDPKPLFFHFIYRYDWKFKNQKRFRTIMKRKKIPSERRDLHNRRSIKSNSKRHSETGY